MLVQSSAILYYVKPIIKSRRKANFLPIVSNPGFQIWKTMLLSYKQYIVEYADNCFPKKVYYCECAARCLYPQAKWWACVVWFDVFNILTNLIMYSKKH